MNEGSLLKLALLGAAGYLAYTYLQNSGLWAQWFGGSAANNFSSASALLQYCQANPSGTASFNGQSAPCASWLQAAAGTGTTAAPTSSTTPSPASPTTQPAAQTPAVPAAIHVTPLTVNQLMAATSQVGYPANPGMTFNMDQWNYFVTVYIDPAAVVDVNYSGYTPGAEITASQYIQYRQAAGVSGLPRGTGYTNPYRWRM